MLLVLGVGRMLTAIVTVLLVVSHLVVRMIRVYRLLGGRDALVTGG